MLKREIYRQLSTQVKNVPSSGIFINITNGAIKRIYKQKTLNRTRVQISLRPRGYTIPITFYVPLLIFQAGSSGILST